MFFIGIDTSLSGNAIGVILERQLKNIKKHYQVRRVFQLNDGDSFSDLVEPVREFYLSKQLTETRRVFSQMKRPTKLVQVPPKIVVRWHDCETPRFVDTLRDAKVAVDGICLNDKQDGYEKLDGPIGMGDDYIMKLDTLLAPLQTVCQQGRLTDDQHLFQNPDQLTRILKQQPIVSDDGPQSILALALAIWVSETIRMIRRY